MKQIIAEATHPLAGKVTLVARRVRVDAVRQNRKHIGQKDMLDSAKDIPDGRSLHIGNATNELAAVVDTGRSIKDLIRMKTADCMPENLPFFVRKAHREIMSRYNLLAPRTKNDTDVLWVIESEDSKTAFDQFALQLRYSKHMP